MWVGGCERVKECVGRGQWRSRTLRVRSIEQEFTGGGCRRFDVEMCPEVNESG